MKTTDFLTGIYRMNRIKTNQKLFIRKTAIIHEGHEET
jgi:hypothetical protein